MTEFRKEQNNVVTGTADNETLDSSGRIDDKISSVSSEGVGVDLYFTSDADPIIGGYNSLGLSKSREVESTVSASIPSGQLVIKSWVTPNFISTPKTLNTGRIIVYIYAAKTAGTKDAAIQARLWSLDPVGSSTILLSSEVSQILTGSKALYKLQFNFDSEQNIDFNDRLILQINGWESGAGTDPTITLYLEGDNNSRLEIRGPSDTVLDGGGSVKIDRNGDSSEPTFSLAPGVQQQIFYNNPILDAAFFPPETAENRDVTSIYGSHEMGTGTGTITSVGTAVTGVGTLFTTELSVDGYIEVGGQLRRIGSITTDLALVIETAFAPDITVGAAFTYGFPDLVLENPILGQPQDWRVSFNYSGKSINAAEGVKIILKNPISGFERTLNTTLPDGETSANFVTTSVQTYADENSLIAPLGTGGGGYQLFIESTKQTINVVIKDIARLTNHFHN